MRDNAAASPAKAALTKAALTKDELTKDELTALPSAEDVRFYAAHGWYLSKKLLTDGEVSALADASDIFYAGHRTRNLPLKSPGIADWIPQDGNDQQRHNDYIHYQCEAIGQILRKPLLGAVAAQLAQVDEIRLFQSTLIYKPPYADAQTVKTGVVPWHFDKDYWATSTSELMLTAFIPFHDCGEYNGTIVVVDGSHRWEGLGGDITSRHFMDRDEHELERTLKRTAVMNGEDIRMIPMNIPRGHVSYHHCRTYHGSGPNRSDTARRAISLHLQDGGNRYRKFQLPDGNIAAYNHDFLVRKGADGEPDYADPDYCPVLWKDSL